MLDESRVRFIAVGQKLSQFVDAVELFHFAAAGLIGAGGVDRLALFFGAESADGIEILERKAERIDRGMADHARFRLGLQRDALAGRKIRMQFGAQWRHRLWRRFQRPAQQVARNENATMNRRTGRRMGKCGQQVRMCQHARAMIRIERNIAVC